MAQLPPQDNSLNAALQTLVRPWLDTLSDLQADAIAGPMMPEPYRSLLVHENHMTMTLEAHYGTAVELDVLQQVTTAEHYTRLIRLIAGPEQRVVETGIARLRLDVLDADVREEILAQETPLGELLIRHDVLRRIEPRWYLRLQPTSPMATYFARPVQQVFGRVGVIHCNEQPAIELLEVLADAPERKD